MMVALLTILMVKVIPQFQEFYAGLNVELPLITRVLMAVAGFVSDNLLLGRAGHRWRPGSRSTPGCGARARPMVLDRLMLRIPYIGGLMRMYATSQLARTLSALLTAACPS